MRGPDGTVSRGWWRFLAVEPGRRMEVEDGFANEDGTPNNDLPRNDVHVRIEDIGGGRTHMSIEAIFPDTAAMELLVGFGMEEGLTQAVGQIDAILAEDHVAPLAAR
jgi:uncharacterized protein YndB with AHSA1/START domain